MYTFCSKELLNFGPPAEKLFQSGENMAFGGAVKT
jgi:hypothetical protein